MTPQVFVALLIAFAGGAAVATVAWVLLFGRVVQQPAFAGPFFRTLQKMAAPGIEHLGCPVCRRIGPLGGNTCKHGTPYSEPCLGCHLESR